MNKIVKSSIAATVLSLAAFSSTGAMAGDACEGQTWPNLSDDCIKQIVSDICKGGGGGDNCDEESNSSTQLTLARKPVKITKFQFQRYAPQRPARAIPATR